MKNNILFSHRPKAGVSVGAFSENGKLYVAVALTNSGWSSNDLFHKDRRDCFSRVKARAILTGRIKSIIETGRASETQFDFETHMTAHDFMKVFKEWFKPTPDESYAAFSELVQDRSADTIAFLIYKKAQSVVYAREKQNA